ncbi:MAG: diguanylate cyclase [Candidatus Kuenenia sp.]|nr:diguanylate cyclase [Candidatus Kuenenia hertensis]
MGKEDNSDIEILIVEDSPTQAAQLKYIVEKNHYIVSLAESGSEALALMETRKPSMVISDIVMPGMSGYELCKKIRDDDNLKDIPFILCSSLSDPKDIVEGLACGADSFIVKPYKESFLVSRINYVLANQAIRRNMNAQFGIEIFFAGKKHFITSERVQIIDLLISTYENAIQKNLELRNLNKELEETKAELTEKTQELYRMSITDELTNIYNRRGFFILLEQQMKIADRTKEKLFLFIIDLNDFKKINDNYGHNEGDRVLKETAIILKKTFRESDIIARMGGDEYAVFSVDSNRQNAEGIVRRLKDNINRYNEQNKNPYKLSVSVGFACYDYQNPCSIDEVIAKADMQMYEEKKKKKVKNV